MKASFSEILAAALEHTPAADRIVLDTGDGAALCFLGDPEDALFAANSLRSARDRGAGAEDAQLAPRHQPGPGARREGHQRPRSNVIGDGINVAQRVMSFAEPNQILVSRSYYEVVSRLAPDYAQLFQYAGLHRDKHVREHEVYEVHLAQPLCPPGGRAGGQPRRAGEAPDPCPGADRAPVPLDPACMERLASALAREIGPVAKLIVRREPNVPPTRARCWTRWPSTCPPRTAPAFSPVGRPCWDRRAPRWRVPRVQATGAAGQSPSQATEQTQSIRPEVLVRAEQMLTVLIGPVARILVRRAAAQAASPRDLFERLAVHIDNPEVRKVFLAEAERL